MFCFGKIIFKKALAYSETELYFPVTFIIWNEITVLSYPLFHPRRLPLTPKLTLTQTQTLTLTGAQFSSGAIFWLSTNPKTNSNLDPDPNPNPNRGQFFLRRGGGGAIIRTPARFLLKKGQQFNVYFTNLSQKLLNFLLKKLQIAFVSIFRKINTYT